MLYQIDDLSYCMSRLGHWSKHPVVDHTVVLTIIDIDAFIRRLISELVAVGKQNVTRADK